MWKHTHAGGPHLLEPVDGLTGVRVVEVGHGDGDLDHAGEPDVVLDDPDVLVANALDGAERADDRRRSSRSGGHVERAAGRADAARRRSPSRRRTTSPPGS